MQGYTRRQLKEDKFVETAQGAAAWTASHRQPVIYSAVAVIVIVLAGLGIYTWRNKQNNAANMALGAAMRVSSAAIRPAGAPASPENKDTYSSTAERGKAAEKQFKTVADQYPHTDAGHIAAYMAGASAIEAGDKAGGEQQLKKVADSGDKNVAALAKLALANFYRANNRLADATRLYKDLEDHPTDTVSKSAAQLAMAEMYEATDPQQATTIYQQIQKENKPDSAAAQEAAAKLNNAKGGPGGLTP
ncbi:MAG TPA: tetratricopeptide repeat protein [Candidatus Acidoferrales bacterium]|nr:tetratricopeptide repeat protein [Candidatus Angelobacter sp.]HWG87552.1 tetratricopeptide repeat protein [Candidatus Acidoferrales bacterium]